MSEVRVEIAKLKDVDDISGIAYQTSKKHQEILPSYFKSNDTNGQKKYLQEAIESQYSEVFKAVCGGKIGALCLGSAGRILCLS